VLTLLRDGSYRKHMDLRLSRAMTEVNARLKNLGLVPWIEPQAGMFLWSQLPDGLDSADIAREALADNIVLAPGNVFSLSQSATSFLRFNVSQSQDDRVFATLRKAMARKR
jgi:DNA-binding transcriptional MocR family regulator